MPEFLQQEFLNNTLAMYLWIGVTVLLLLLFKRLLSKGFASVLYFTFPNTRSYVSRQQFLELIVKPLEWLIIILVLVLSFNKLTYPAILDIELYKVSTKDLVDAAGRALLVIFFIRFVRRFIDFIGLLLGEKAKQTPEQSDDQLVYFFRDFLKVIVLIFGVLLFANFVFRYDVSNVITGLSIVTAAVALATRESLENLIASFIILIDKPFVLGDLVKIDSYMGTVEKIGFRSTKLRTDQKTYATVPNKKMVDAILDNLSMRTQRKVEIRLELRPDAKPAQLLDVTRKAEKLMLQKEEIQNHQVFVTDISSGSVVISVDYFTGPIDFDIFLGIKQSIQLELLSIIQDAGLELAGLNLR
jgi:MscS family membrane protein